MNVVQLSLFAVAGVLLAIVLKKERPEYGILLTVVVCICIFFSLLGRLSILLESVNHLRELATMDAGYFRTVLKMIGITYVAEFAVNLCKDAGYQAVAGQIELFGKLALLSLSMPVVLALLETVNGFL